MYFSGLEPIEEFIHMKIPVLWPHECGLEEVEDLSKGLELRKAQRIRKPGERKDRKGPSQRSERRKSDTGKAVQSRKREKRKMQGSESKAEKKEVRKIDAEQILKKEVEGKNVRRINLSEVKTEEKKGFFSFIRRIFGK